MLLARLCAALWLCVASPAAAQRAVLPLEASGRSTAIAPLITPSGPAAFSAPVLSAPAIQTTLLMPAPAIALAPAVAPAALKLSAASSALAQFSSLDLKSAPAADVRGAGETLMARVLGAETAGDGVLATALSAPADAPLPAPEPEQARKTRWIQSVQLLSRPLHETVELGRTARVLHYMLETLAQFVKAAIAWQVTGSPAAGLAVLAVDLIKMPPIMTAQSMADLGVRYWWRKLATVKRLAKAPGVTRIRVLTTGQVEFSGLLAWRKVNTGLVFLDAENALPADVAGFGAAIPVTDVAGKRMRLVLTHEGVADDVVWTPTLAELLSHTPIPAEIAAAWRERLDADKKDKSPLRRLFDFKKGKELKIDAYLADDAGGETPLGAIAFGDSVKRLVGLGRWDRVKALFRIAPAPRPMPLSDTQVERGGQRRIEGVINRAWRRLLGRLVVQP